MHYGREFLSVQQWNSEKAQNLRQACARVRTENVVFSGWNVVSRPRTDHHFHRPTQTLSTWGMGLASQ